MTTHSIPKIQVQVRGRTGSRDATRLRKAGQLPAVIYGHKKEPVHVSMDLKQMVDLLHRNTHVLEVALEKDSQPCLIKDVQWNHLGSQIVHVDLARVDLTERVKVEVDLVLTGEAVGLKEEGAILEHPVSRIAIECLATQIPDQIKVDVSHLKVGDTVTIKDIKPPAGVTVRMPEDVIVASITVVKEEVVVAAPVEGGAAEPEVIGKKAEEGAEGVEGEAKAAPKAGEKGEKEKK